MTRSRISRPLLFIGLALAYAAAARLSLLFAIPAGGIPPLWLPAGIGLAVLALGGIGYWPGLAAGSLLIWWTTGHPTLVVVALVGADVLEPVLGARLLPRLGFRPTLERVRDVWTLAGSALLLALLTASLGLLALVIGGEVGGGFSTLFETWWTWFAARLLGIMVAAPLCLVWSRPAPARPPLADRPLEAAALVATTIVLAALAAWLLPGLPRLAMPAMLMVCVIWGASRGHQHGATLLTLLVAALCLLSVRFGPLLDLGLGDLSLSPVIARFAVSLAVFAATGLVLAASVIEREAAVSQQRLTGEVQRVLFELAPFGLIALDGEQRVTAWNPAAERIFGWRADEVLGRTTPVVQPEAVAEAAALLRQLRDGHTVQGVRVQRSRKDGSLVDLRVSLTPVGGDSPHLTRVISIVEDLSARREDMEAMREDEERYQLVFEGVSEAIFLHEAGTNRILDANLAAEQRYGYSHAELLRLTTTDLSAEPERTKTAIQEGIDSGGLTVPLRWHRSKDGRIFPVTISIRRLSWRGRTAGVSVVREISQELNQAEEARRREEYLEAMLAQASDFVTILDHTGIIRYQSPSVTRILGWKEEELVGHPVTEFLHEEDRPRLRDALRRGLTEPGAIVTSVVRIRRPDGSWRVLEGIGRFLPDTPGIGGFLLNARDITERREAEAQSQRSRERYEIVANATSDVVWEWDNAGPNSWWSEGLTRVFGWNPEELSPMLEAWSERIHPEDRARALASFHAALEGDTRHWRAEYRFRRKSGEYAMVVDQAWSIVRAPDGKALRMIGAITDVTEQREAERLLAESREQLRQATKMEAMGRL
ncbi:MAG TPA: PAS domain S-box protein, partial [Gemmatimonadales bacterium]|nr:PAS domain S-box protein [Gemmatimonadales bacterium]